MLSTKPTVRFRVITPALLYMLGVLERLSRTMFGLPEEGLVITSGSDSTHMTASKHYTGEAIDLRSKTLSATIRNDLIATLRAELGPQFTVLFEHEGKPQEHIHCQVKRGRRFDPDALVQDRHAAALMHGLRARGERGHARKVMHLHVAARARCQRRPGANDPAAGDESHDGARAVDGAAR